MDELQLQAGFAKPGWVATFAEFVCIAVVGAKTEALFPGRVPHVRPSVHGLKKTGRSSFERFCNAAKTLRPRARVLAHGMRALEESVFRPMYAQANMGHPSRTNDRGYEIVVRRFRLQSNLDKCESPYLPFPVLEMTPHPVKPSLAEESCGTAKARALRSGEEGFVLCSNYRSVSARSAVDLCYVEQGT